MKYLLATTLAAFIAMPALAATKTYQATGAIVDVRDDAIVIDKGKEGNWEIARDPSTKVQGELKKGSKATVEYRMTATSVEVKDSGKPAGAAKDKPAAKDKAAPAPAR